MSKTKLQIIIFTSFLLFSFTLTVNELTLESICTPIGNRFHFFVEDKTFEYSLAHNFARGKLIGQGSFGRVRSVDFHINNIAEAAVKEVKNEPKSLPELGALLAFSSIGIGNKFYGCQYSNDRILIASERLQKDLGNEATLLAFRKSSCSKFVSRIKDIVDDLVVMQSHRLMHNDIKEENVMTDDNFERFTLIDFGLVQSIDDRLKSQGSPVYMSPGKWRIPIEMPKHTDDLYSLGVLAGVLNNDNGFSTIHRDYSKKAEGAELPFGCFRNYLTDYCQKIIKENVRRLLTRANLGNFHSGSKRRKFQNVNFTTLMAMMIEYYDYPFTLAQTSQILARHIKEFEALEHMDPAAYQPPQKDATYGKNDVPDLYDFKRKHPRIHPDDLANYQVKLQMALNLELKLEEDRQAELSARLAMLDAEAEKIAVEKEVEALLNSESAERKKQLEMQVGQSAANFDRRYREYEEAKLEFEQATQYMKAYHKKSQVQNEVIALVVQEAKELSKSVHPQQGNVLPEEQRIDELLKSLHLQRKSMIGKAEDVSAKLSSVLQKTRVVISQYRGSENDLPPMINNPQVLPKPSDDNDPAKRQQPAAKGFSLQKVLHDPGFIEKLNKEGQNGKIFSPDQMNRLRVKMAMGINVAEDNLSDGLIDPQPFNFLGQKLIPEEHKIAIDVLKSNLSRNNPSAFKKKPFVAVIENGVKEPQKAVDFDLGKIINEKELISLDPRPKLSAKGNNLKSPKLII